MFGIDSNSIQIERAKNWCKNIEAANGVDIEIKNMDIYFFYDF